LESKLFIQYTPVGDELINKFSSQNVVLPTDITDIRKIMAFLLCISNHLYFKACLLGPYYTRDYTEQLFQKNLPKHNLGFKFFFYLNHINPETVMERSKYSSITPLAQWIAKEDKLKDMFYFKSSVNDPVLKSLCKD